MLRFVSAVTYDVLMGMLNVKPYSFTQLLPLLAVCPRSFTHIATVNGCYNIVSDKLEWSAAGLNCRSLHQDAHLLVIDNALEQTAIAEMLASVSGKHAIIRDISTFSCLFLSLL